MGNYFKESLSMLNCLDFGDFNFVVQTENVYLTLSFNSRIKCLLKIIK